MQAFGIASALHHAPGKFVDDDDLVVLNDVVRVTGEHRVRAQGLINVMNQRHVGKIIQIAFGNQTGVLQ